MMEEPRRGDKVSKSEDGAAVGYRQSKNSD